MICSFAFTYTGNVKMDNFIRCRCCYCSTLFILISCNISFIFVLLIIFSSSFFRCSGKRPVLGISFIYFLSCTDAAPKNQPPNRHKLFLWVLSDLTYSRIVLTISASLAMFLLFLPQAFTLSIFFEKKAWFCHIVYLNI